MVTILTYVIPVWNSIKDGTELPRPTRILIHFHPEGEPHLYFPVFWGLVALKLWIGYGRTICWIG
jgi:hypothetical protein